MKLVIANMDHCQDFLSLADAFAWLSEFPIEPGGVLCLGIRLEGFSAPVWQATRTWLGQAGGVSTSELTKASSFLHVEDAVRHLLARSLLRHVVARQCEVELPDTLPVNAWGKPEGVGWGIHFNLSHAGGEIWLACSRDAAVGVDVEQDCPDLLDLKTVLHPAEADELSSAAAALSRRRLWARKEAVAKATGRGLSLPLACFQVALDERVEGWLLHAPLGFPAPWTTCDLLAPGSAAVALAVRGRAIAVTWRLARVACMRVG